MKNLFLGIDIGSSSVKTTIFDAAMGKSLGKATFPSSEQAIESPHTGWAEQDPQIWWDHFKAGYKQIVKRQNIDTSLISGIGITYQMHGLVLVDKEQRLLKKSIIWCDSRAVDIGEKAFQNMGKEHTLRNLLNSPGNFTASKLRWVQQNQPAIYEKIHKFMLPGDYIAMKLSGEITTTRTGLSEGTFWDFPNRNISSHVMNEFEFDDSLFPNTVPATGEQAQIQPSIAQELELRKSVKIFYRSGDQPNNAFSLNVLHPGEIAATAGTSGVIYAVTDQDVYDKKSRINTFLHVNDTKEAKRNGVLICVNGTGILYHWLKKLLNSGAQQISYSTMNDMAKKAPAGSEDLIFLPFGNGAERILENKILNANVLHLDFNRHTPGHLIRSGMEGIVFALNLGFDILKTNNIPYNEIKAGYANLFLSKTFREIFANVTRSTIKIYNTDGADGAARGAALGAGFYHSDQDAFESLELMDITVPQNELIDQYADYYGNWKHQLETITHKNADLFQQ
jgi:xylulokinase